MTAMHIGYWQESQKGRDHKEVQDVAERIILKLADLADIRGTVLNLGVP
jgi:hypothetical protein